VFIDSSTVPVGADAPDFTLPDTHGAPVTLSSLRGRPVVLAFLRGFI
jgi:peroxiredoxin